MYMNAPNHKNISLEIYETSFKEKIMLVLERISRIFNRSSQENSDLKFLNLSDPTVQHRIAEIKEATESISLYLKEEHIIYQEYYDFREMQRLMNQSLDYGSIEELKIILKIFNEFKNLTEFKFNLLSHYSPSSKISFRNIDEKSKKAFEERYKEFSEFFFDCGSEYYAIFEGDCEEDVSEFFELMKDNILN